MREKSEKLKIIGQINEAQLKLVEIEEKINQYSTKAKEYRAEAYSQQKKDVADNTPSIISKLISKAIYYENLAEQVMYTDRHIQLSECNRLKAEAKQVQATIEHNKRVLEKHIITLEEVKKQAEEMVINSENKIKNVQSLLVSQEKELVRLVGTL